MLGIVVFALVIVAIAIIAGCVIWGWRNDTLWESDQERFDRRFDKIIAVEAYSDLPRQTRS